MPINSYKDYLQNTYKTPNMPQQMKCEKARTFFPVLAVNRLQGSEKSEVEHHLKNCNSCSASLEKTRKLQALLSLKRHEQPDELFMRNFVSDFHRRLYADVVQERSRSTLWTRISEMFSFDISLIRVGQSFAALMILGVIAFQFYPAKSSQNGSISKNDESVVEVESRFKELVVANNSDSSIYVLDRVAYKPSNNGPVVLQF
jgi:hypothetical protein